ncbi:MAG: hypothetical protein KA419_05365 [Acidobacteria bacterium]|nr:hypothetical protein [Acidobacteriota bacterium]
MKPVLIIGTVIVQLALVSYSVAVFAEQRRQRVTRTVLFWLSAGLLFDVAATTCMIVGSRNPWYTPHGLLGYSSLAGMAVDAALIWRARLKYGPGSPVSRGLHFYSRLAYLWWVLAYVTGALLVLVFRNR